MIFILYYICNYNYIIYEYIIFLIIMTLKSSHHNIHNIRNIHNIQNNNYNHIAHIDIHFSLLIIEFHFDNHCTYDIYMDEVVNYEDVKQWSPFLDVPSSVEF